MGVAIIFTFSTAFVSRLRRLRYVSLSCISLGDIVCLRLSACTNYLGIYYYALRLRPHGTLRPRRLYMYLTMYSRYSLVSDSTPYRFLRLLE